MVGLEIPAVVPMICAAQPSRHTAGNSLNTSSERTPGMKLHLLRAVNSWKRGTSVCAVALAMAVTLVSQTKRRPNRITHELNSGPEVTLSGTVHPLTRQANDLGEANPGMRRE